MVTDACFPIGKNNRPIRMSSFSMVSFLLDCKIQVREGTELSEEFRVENGAPQGSVISPVLFHSIVSDMYTKVKGDHGVSFWQMIGPYGKGVGICYISSNKKKQT